MDYDTCGNRYCLKEEYVRAIVEGGGIPVGLYPPADRPRGWSGDAEAMLDDSASAGEILQGIDGILFSGGEDVDPLFFGESARRENGEINPVRDRFELCLAREALARNIPSLGICRGIQIMAVACGGGVWQDLGMMGGTRVQHQAKAPDWYPIHWAEVEEGSRLASILGQRRLRVNSSHHQAVQESRDGRYSVCGRAVDQVIEAIEDPELRFWIGVQWHPERMMHDPVQKKLFQAFCEVCMSGEG